MGKNKSAIQRDSTQDFGDSCTVIVPRYPVRASLSKLEGTNRLLKSCKIGRLRKVPEPSQVISEVF